MVWGGGGGGEDGGNEPVFPGHMIFSSLQSPLHSIEKQNKKCNRGLCRGEWLASISLPFFK